MTERPVGERVSALEADSATTRGQIAEIFDLLHQVAEAHSATALQHNTTAVQLAQLTQRVNQQHIPETCPNTGTVRALQQVYWGGAAIIAFLAVTGLLTRLGDWLRQIAR